jgi:fructokinase
MPGSSVDLKNRLTFAGLGEVLFDVFEDGAATLGGAPLNVAVHCHQLAAALGLGRAVVASRIGNDLHGRQIFDALRSRGVSTEYLQLDPNHATGCVSVFMRHGEPGYQIEAGAAWDFLQQSEALDELAASCNAICFGSLAQRSPASRETIRWFLKHSAGAVRLYDVNLRRNTLTNEPGYSAEIIEESCRLASMMKLNCAELVELSALFHLPAPVIADEDGIRRAVKQVLQRFPVDSVILTRGPEGTKLFTRNSEFSGHAVPVPLETVYPVGAGDACSAGILFGSVLGWHPDDAIDLANQMGAWVASQLSATPSLPDSIVTLARQVIQSQTAA